MVNWENHIFDSDMRREELKRIIENSLDKLSIEELDTLYYYMLTKDYIK